MGDDGLDRHTLFEHVARVGERGPGTAHFQSLPWPIAAAVAAAILLAGAWIVHRAALRAGADEVLALRALGLWLAFPGSVLLVWQAPWGALAALVALAWLCWLRSRLIAGAAVSTIVVALHPIGLVAVVLATAVPRHLVLRAGAAAAAAVAVGLAVVAAPGCSWTCAGPVQSPLVAAQRAWRALHDLAVEPLPLRAAGADAFTYATLALVGGGCVVALLLLGIVAVRHADRASAAACATAALVLLLWVPQGSGFGSALALVPAVPPAALTAARWTARGGALRFPLLLALLASMLGATVALAATWQPLV